MSIDILKRESEVKNEPAVDLKFEEVEQFESTILIVDDEEDILKLMKNLLEMKGYKALMAPDGETALKISKGVDLGAVISDYRMPGMNGVELLSRLREEHTDVPMILATAFADVNIVIEAINKGRAYKLIRKPWDPFDLQQEVKSAVEYSISEKRRKELEARLKEQNEILEERVLERTSELDKVIEELQAANDTISQTYQHLLQSDKLATMGLMAGTIAHDIANPLTVVLARARLLLMKGTLGDAESKNLNIIIKNSQKIERLIFSITRFARKSSNEYTDIDLMEVLRESLLMLSKSLNVQSITLEEIYEIEEPIVWGEPNELEQVFTNLIQNALQAMETGGKLTIRVNLKDNFIRIIFEDTGPGIPEEKLSDIFEAFYTTKKEGTGLGLNICKRIIQEHSGKISVESKIGEGTKFVIDLPEHGNGRK
ncbi:MAG: response regulator [Candidatus Marinimicrobia bacterium]|nr:response regulator [Candidatus Neomarinimicrobiota bacterium]